MRKLLRTCNWMCFSVVISVHITPVYGQIPHKIQPPKNAVYKDGKYYFFNMGQTKVAGRVSSAGQPKMNSCQLTTLNTKSRYSTITSGNLVLYITSKNATCGYGSGSIIVQVANGVPPYSYVLDIGAPQVTGNFPSVNAGAHVVKVTDADGSVATAEVDLVDLLQGPILVTISNTITPNDCFNPTGEIAVQAVGGKPPYTYTLDMINFQISNIFGGLHSGIYSVYVKDINGCVGSAGTFLLSGACDPIGGSSSLYACGNNASSYMSDNWTNGPYLYSSDGVNYQNSYIFNNIGPGIFNEFVKDRFGEVQVFSFNVFLDCNLGIDYIAVDAACMMNNGIMTVSTINGTPPFSYTIDGVNYQSSNTFNNLAPGIYFVTVKDATGISNSLPATVYDKCPVVKANTSPESCSLNDGTITAGGFKGTKPYQYSIDGINFGSENVFTNLKAGKYTVTIMDALGFTGTTQVLVLNNCLNISVVPVNASCGKANGSISCSATSGTPPYMYSIDNVNFQSQNIFSSLDTGNYKVLVKDGNGSTDSISVIIGDIPGPQLTFTKTSASCLNTDGSIIASATGGLSPYNYSLDGTNFQISNTFTGLDTGARWVFVQDLNHCISKALAVITLNDNLWVKAGVDTVTCDGKILKINSSSNGQTFSWTPSNNLSDADLLSPYLTAKTDVYTLTASLGICQQKSSFDLTTFPAPEANAGEDISICFGKSAQLNGTGGTTYLWSPATYLDDPGKPNPNVQNPTGSVSYSLKVTDINGCESVNHDVVVVTVTPSPKVYVGNDTAVIKNSSVVLTANDVNNSGFIDYRWSPIEGLDNSNSKKVNALITNDIVYSVKATTADGCESEAAIAIKIFTLSDIIVPNAFTPNMDGINDVLHVKLLGIKQLQYFRIYNRWGQQIFATTDSGIGWDGAINGIIQDTGTYVWMACGIDFTGKMIQRHGTTTLIR